MRFPHYLLILAFLTLGCRRPSTNAITIVGSTSVQPFIEKLAEEYMAQRPGSKINVQGGGSAAGIIAVRDRACDMGMLSRPLRPEEAGPTLTEIAWDAIVVIIHPENQIAGLTLEQISGIFAGTIDNWSRLGGADKRIVVVTREEGSGTRGAFEEAVMKKREISDAALVQDSNGAVREIVASDRNAIGYISFGLLEKRVKALSVDGVNPSVTSIAAGQYQLKRPFILLVAAGSQCVLADSFRAYVLSPAGQTSLAQEGLLPIQP